MMTCSKLYGTKRKKKPNSLGKLKPSIHSLDIGKQPFGND